MITLAQVNAKLRRRDYKNASLLFGCINFATALISAFAVIMQSNTVQTVLPQGGDTRKQVLSDKLNEVGVRMTGDSSAAVEANRNLFNSVIVLNRLN